MSQPYDPQLDGKTLLLVDDEPLFASSVADALMAKHHGLHVLHAHNGVEALDYIERFKVHTMVTDLRMPGLGGFELLRELSQRGVYIRTILVTAHGNMDIATHSLRQGVVAYMEKPVDLTTLLDLVIWLLRQPEADHITWVSLQGFLQLLSMERSSCRVRVIGTSGQGTLSFDNGVLFHARCGELEGDAAVLEIAGWTDSAIYVEPGLEREEQNVNSPVMELLLEAARLSDEDEADVFEGLDSEPPQVSSWIPSNAHGAAFGAMIGSANEPTNQERNEIDMANVNETLDTVMSIEGAFAVALVDYESGMTLGTRCSAHGFDIDVAASGNTQVVRSKMAVMQNLKIGGAIEDILITLDTQYHLIRPLSTTGHLFLYLAIDRKRGNLGLARHTLASLEKELRV